MNLSPVSVRMLCACILFGTVLAGCGKQGGSDAGGAGGSSSTSGTSGTSGTSTGGSGASGGSAGSAAGKAVDAAAGAASSAADKASDAAGKANQAASGAAASAGAAIDDSVITTKLKTALLADTTLKGAKISVETRHGEVVLTGSVTSPAQKDHAAQIAQALNGVKAVNNKLALNK